MFTQEYASGETPSYEGFVKFCESKDPQEKYYWASSRNCACGQYLKSIDQFKENWLTGTNDVMSELNRIAGGNRDPVKRGGAGGYNEADWTFGKCAERVKEAMVATAPKKVLEVV